MDNINSSFVVSRLIKDIAHHIKFNIGKRVADAGITGITPTQGVVLGILSGQEQMMMSELSRKMGLNNSTVSGIIDRLEKQDLVERLRSEEDKRVVYIKLTPRVKKIEENLHSTVEGIVEKIIAEKGTPEDFDKIVEGLNILKRLLVDSDRS